MDLLIWLIPITAALGIALWHKRNVKKVHQHLSDKANFDQFIIEKNLTKEQKIELCQRFHLKHSIDNDNTEVRKKITQKYIKNLTVVWAGDTENIIIEYITNQGELLKREISPSEVNINTKYFFYITGLCHLRNEERTFNLKNIKSIQLANGSFCDFPSWCKTALNVDVLTLIPDGEKTNFDTIIWQGSCPLTTFTYRTTQSRSRVSVYPQKLILDTIKDIYLEAIDRDGVVHTYRVHQIETMLSTVGFKKFHFDNWINEVLNYQNLKSTVNS